MQSDDGARATRPVAGREAPPLKLPLRKVWFMAICSIRGGQTENRLSYAVMLSGYWTATLYSHLGHLHLGLPAHKRALFLSASICQERAGFMLGYSHFDKLYILVAIKKCIS